jgi:hypothetical protein
MTPKRPTVVVVFAILQLSLGGIGFLCMGCTGALQLAGVNKLVKQIPQPGGRPNLGLEMEEFIQRKHPYHQTVQIVQPAMGMAAALLMMISGLGLLQMKRWARWLAIGDACFIILLVLAVILYTMIVRGPAVNEFVAEKSKDPNLQPQEKMALNFLGSGGTLATFGSLFNLVFAAYPVIVIIFMLLPNVSKAFRGQRTTEEDEVQDDLDEGWGGKMPGEER